MKKMRPTKQKNLKKWVCHAGDQRIWLAWQKVAERFRQRDRQEIGIPPSSCHDDTSGTPAAASMPGSLRRVDIIDGALAPFSGLKHSAESQRDGRSEFSAVISSARIMSITKTFAC